MFMQITVLNKWISPSYCKSENFRARPILKFARFYFRAHENYNMCGMYYIFFAVHLFSRKAN